MDEVWVHFRWRRDGNPMIFGVHGTEDSARLDCPVDLLDPEDDEADPANRWVLEGVAPLGRDPFMLEGLEGYLDLLRDLES